MTNSKGSTPPTPQPSQECCMCGDYGLSYELFRCKICQLRSQHSYCSNLYPKSESTRVCNWCLTRNDDSIDRTQNSPNSSSSHRNSSEDDFNKKKLDKRVNLKLQINKPIKKQRSPEQSPSEKRIGRRGGIEESGIIRRSKSEEMSNGGSGGGGGGGGITKQVYRNKVRRYKLLDEVSSQ